MSIQQTKGYCGLDCTAGHASASAATKALHSAGEVRRVIRLRWGLVDAASSDSLERTATHLRSSGIWCGRDSVIHSLVDPDHLPRPGRGPIHAVHRIAGGFGCRLRLGLRQAVARSCPSLRAKKRRCSGRGHRHAGVAAIRRPSPRLRGSRAAISFTRSRKPSSSTTRCNAASAPRVWAMSAAALLERNANPTAEEVKRAISGNICRCGSYPHVVAATLAAAKARKSRPRAADGLRRGRPRRRGAARRALQGARGLGADVWRSAPPRSEP